MNTGESVSFGSYLMPESTKAVLARYQSPLFRDRQ
jgi:hypothetical protein